MYLIKVFLFSRVFDDITNQYFDQGPELLTSKNAQGRSPVEIACMLGRTDALQELIKRSIDFNAANPSSESILYLGILAVFFIEVLLVLRAFGYY